MANGFYDHKGPCSNCGYITWQDESCPKCGVPAEVVEGKRELTAEEIIQRNLPEEMK